MGSKIFLRDLEEGLFMLSFINNTEIPRGLDPFYIATH